MRTPNNQLNLRAQHPDFQTFLDFNERESERVRNEYYCHLDQKFGASKLQAIDVFPSHVSESPIFVFIHGGYWRALDKRSYSFVAEPFVKNNVTVCVVNYRLIPEVNMATLLDDIYDGIHWIQRQASCFNGDPNKMVLSGHSAGGHLALMAYLMNEKLRPSIRAVCSLSGIFDLSFIKNSYLNDVLGLNEKDVFDFSVSNKDLSVLECPTLLSVGSRETDFFITESKNLYLNNKSKAPLEYLEYEGLNHYQIIHKLGQMDSPLVQFILKYVR
ncbi:alpha/beta hydrolase [Aureisphaera galaxeae]|uniref:alpha/beta hydrolase n=1 Tax=Aureisphaera galaxeae TaxID=1538023 RepID=UPI00234FC0E3|nr:alpha/beta hydrolase [Aureisphaera galaxeae]MDC8003426.1 alpha/beta hydrolase [Aureisphaera galaxeae]